MSKNEVYGYQYCNAMVGSVMRKLQVRKTGTAVWVTKINNKIVAISGKINEGVFIPKREDHKNWIDTQFAPKRDKINGPKTKDELDERMSDRARMIRDYCAKVFGKGAETFRLIPKDHGVQIDHSRYFDSHVIPRFRH